MAVSFNHHDKTSWYFGAMSRQEAIDVLTAEREGGVFLVRDSSSIEGDYVLCVKEDNKVSHYIINKIVQGDPASAQARYKIGDQMFNDLPALLNFYKVHYLDTTPLIRPAMKKVEKVQARYDFDGKDPDDLPFRKGEILTVVSKDEEQWWTARNSLGQTGSIPVPYVVKYEDKAVHNPPPASPPTSVSSNQSNQSSSNSHHHTPQNPSSTHNPHHGPTSPTTNPISPSNPPPNRPPINLQRQVPCYARVKQAKYPSPYDTSALRLEVGDTVKVTKMNLNGQWEGELNGKCGVFPFTHVEVIQEDSSKSSNQTPNDKR